MIGLYGVMAYTVEQRTREIGIRVALGAHRGNVVWLVMKEVVVMVGGRLRDRTTGGLDVIEVVGDMLYGIQPNDPISIVGAMLILAVVAMIAGYIPAARVARIDPLRALRYE